MRQVHPRLFIGTTAERTAFGLAIPPQGFYYLDTDDNIIYWWDGAAWQAFGGGTDADAIHDNVAGEINAIAEKNPAITNDVIVIEDSADGFNKKKVKLANVLVGAATLAGSAGDADTVDSKHAADLLDKATYDTDNDGIVNDADYADVAGQAGNANTVDNLHAADFVNVESSVVKTVGAGKDYATIQAAFDWFSMQNPIGLCRIDVDAGSYNEALTLIGLQNAVTVLELRGDTRLLAGISWVSGNGANLVTANIAAITNGGGGTIKLSNSGNDIIITCTAGVLNLGTDGWAANDKILVFDNSSAWTEYTISSIAHTSDLISTITLTGAAPAVGNLGTSLTLLPNRTIYYNANVITNYTSLTIAGFYVKNTTNTNFGIYQLGGTVYLARCLVAGGASSMYGSGGTAAARSGGSNTFAAGVGGGIAGNRLVTYGSHGWGFRYSYVLGGGIAGNGIGLMVDRGAQNADWTGCMFANFLTGVQINNNSFALLNTMYQVNMTYGVLEYGLGGSNVGIALSVGVTYSYLFDNAVKTNLNADMVDGAHFVDWTTYTSTWSSASNPQPAIGNGSIVARYAKIGKVCFVHIQITIGVSTTLGTGVWYFTLPFTAASNMMHPGTALAIDQGVGYFPGICLMANTTVLFVMQSSNNALWSPTVPMSWVSTDIGFISLVYELP